MSYKMPSKAAFSGAGQLATELTISADEFENYDIFATPISLAFHLREFNVSFLVSLRASEALRAPYELANGID
jgi:cell cycle checkpoint control protein RAD9A